MSDIQALGSTSTAHVSQRHDRMQAVMTAVEDKLGISADDLKAARKSGQSLADVAASKGVSRDDLLATVKQALSGAQGGGGGGADADGDHDGDHGDAASKTSGATSTVSLDTLAASIVDRKPQQIGGQDGQRHHRHAPAASATSTGAVAFQLPPSTSQATYV